MFEKQELQRYSRQIMLPEFGTTGQHKLKQAKVLMIGAGGLGCPVLQYLAAAGVGTIGIVDDDVVDVTNLHRQILYNLNDVGKNKALVAKEKLQMINPHVHPIAHQDRLTVDNGHDIFKQYDLVIDGSDNFPTRYLVNDVCVALKKTLVFGSIFKFEAQVSVFNYKDGPSYIDLFPEMPEPNEMPNCAEIGVIGVLPGMVGMFMANEAIKVIGGMGEVLSGKLLTIDALRSDVNVFKFGNGKTCLASEEIVTSRASNNDEITLSQLQQWLLEKTDEIVLVDVRENYEFEEFNMGGLNIPWYELTERCLEIPQQKIVIFCCASGSRSKYAATVFKQLTGRMCLHVGSGLNNNKN